MKTRIFISMLALAVSSSAYANGVEMEVGYQRQNIDFEGDGDISTIRGDLRFAAAYLAIGYRVAFNETISGTIEATYSLAFGEDQLDFFTFDEAETYGIGYRITQKLNNGWALFGRVDYRQLDLRVENFFQSDPELSESGFGFGAGLEWRGLTFGYTAFTGDLDNLQTFNVGYRFRFGSNKW